MGKIIWLASYPKSGNTWLRAFLHNLLRNLDKPFEINQLTAFTGGDSRSYLYRLIDPRPATEYSFEDVAKLRPQVHEALTRRSPDNVFVKTHNALIADFDIPAISLSLTAGSIYVIRNPLDVVISYANHLSSTIDATTELMALPGSRTGNHELVVSEVMSSWSVHVESWTKTPSPSLHVVRYEDMQKKPWETFNGVAKFLGLKPPRERIEKAIRQSSFKVLQEQERRTGFIERSPLAERFFREGRMDQWRSVLTPEQVGKIVAAHRAQMERFGYVPPEQRESDTP
ncbi:MAG: sulfotransferase domain-containing protein [Alphaproteobacteria bacterium]|nr:sulfotransferase domain-containing protein [Alphaproteobacteria bacterium]